MSQQKTSKITGQKPATLMVKLRLSDDARRDYAFMTQRWLPKFVCLALPTRNLDAETRHAFAQLPHQKKNPNIIPLMLPTCRGTKYWCAPFVPDSDAAWKRLLAVYQQDYQEEEARVQLKRDEELAVSRDDLCARLAKLITAQVSLVPAIPSSYAGCVGYEEVVSLGDQVNAQIAAQQIAAAQARDLPRRQHEAEREAWTARYGSDALRACASDTEQREQAYLHERARLEYPAYALIPNRDREVSPCPEPDPAVQAEADHVGGTVVWCVNVAWLHALDHAPVPQDTPQAPLAVEYQAVQIAPYLDIYTLVRLYPHLLRSCADRVFCSRESLDPW